MPTTSSDNEDAEIVVGERQDSGFARRRPREAQDAEERLMLMQRKISELEEERIGEGEELVRTRGVDFRLIPKIITFHILDTLSTGDGKDFFPITDFYDGHNIVSARAYVGTAGNGSADTQMQVHNITQSADIFSTVLTIDQGEHDSKNSSTAAVINKANNELSRGDVLRLDIDQIDGGGGERDLIVVLETALPEAALKNTNF